MGHNDELSTEARWGVGCLIAAAAMVGLVILLMYVAFTFDLPIWAQVVLGFGLTLGGGLLTWLIVSALGQSRQKGADGPPIASVPDRPLDQPPPGETGAE